MKYILLGILLFSLVSCGGMNSVTVQQTEQSSATWETQEPAETIVLPKVEKDVAHMNMMELSNSLYQNGGWENLKEKIAKLSYTGASNENRVKASLLQSFVWENVQAVQSRDVLCKEKPDFCTKQSLTITTYRPVDTQGNIIDDVSLSINGKDEWLLNARNQYDGYTDFVQRIKLSKKGFLDFYGKYIISQSPLGNESLKPVLLAADKKEVIDAGTGWTFATKNFLFEIPAQAFSYADGTAVSWDIELYFFDIGSQDGDINALNLDSFDSETLSYRGWSMITHGMPLIKAYKGDRELVIAKPITGKWTIQDLTKAVGIDLQSAPKNMALSLADCEKYGIPPFWTLNEETGVWYSSSLTLLDSQWNYSFSFLP